MGVPLAVSPSVKGPGIYLRVNLLAAASSPGTATQYGLLMAPRSTAGNLTPDTEVRLISGPDEARAAFGQKTPGYLAAVAFFQRYPAGVLYGIAPTASTGASATGTITFASTPTVARTVHADIAGKIVEVPWAPAEDATTIAARLVSYANARDDMPATLAAVAGVVTLTFPVAGPWGNDVRYSVTLIDGAGGTATAAGATFTGGTTEPDFTAALTTVSGTEFAYICPCLSNADAQATGAATNLARLRTHINGLNTGRSAKLQQGIVGMSGALSSAKTGAIARNDPVLEIVFAMNGRGLPAELAGEELGSRMASVALDPAANRCNTVLPSYIGAADLIADTPTDPEIEDALSNGVSIVSYNRQGEAVLARPITSHSQDANGNPDSRCFDVSGVDGMYAIANDVEIFLAQTFPNAKVSRDQEPGAEPLPDGVVEERDIKATLITRLRTWVARGVARKDKLDEAIDNGTLIVRVNPSDESQVDVVIPAAIVKPLAKFGVVVNKVA